MDQLKVKDRILENLSLSVKKLQSYFAACEDETPAIRNHDRVLQRLCEHLDHALLYGLQDISSGYWVLVLHFTRREAIRQIEELRHIATNLGRSRAWLYLALSESSLESYLRLFQENQGLLQKYYYKNALVCSHDHLTLFLTLVSGLEFIRFDLDLDVPYLDVTPYMPEYYKPQNLPDFEERLPSADSLSLHSFTSTNLEWDDSAIAPSSEDFDFGDIFPIFPADWEEGDLTDPTHCPCSGALESPPVVGASAPLSPPFRRSHFNEESDANASADATPVHRASRQGAADGGDGESTELEVIRVARRRKPGKKRRGKSTSSGHDAPPAPLDNGTGDPCLDGTGHAVEGTVTAKMEEGTEGSRRLSETVDSTSADAVGQPVGEVAHEVRVALEGAEEEEEEEEEEEGGDCPGPLSPQEPFLGDSEDEAPNPIFLEAPPAPVDFYRFTPHSPDSAVPGGGHHDSADPGQSEAGCHEGSENEREEGVLAGLDTPPSLGEEAEEAEEEEEDGTQPEEGENSCSPEDEGEGKEEPEEEKTSPAEITHPAEFRVDNNHLLLLMLHVFRENEEQLFKMVSMSTGHTEGDLQALYILLTDCYIYLLRKGAAEKPYTVEDFISYSELDYLSVGLDQQTVRLVCTNRRRQFLLDTADMSLTAWFLDALSSAMIKGCRQPPYPSVLTDATMERLSLTKFVSQEAHCEVSEVCVLLYSLVHWEDPLDVTLGQQVAPNGPSDSASTKEGPLLYRAGTTYLGRELWKSCYLVLSNGILYQYPERTDVTPLVSITMGGEHCGGCRRSHSSERRHSFQVILTERPPLELSACDERDMAEWMQVLCQSVSKGMIPQGVTPSPCIPCCLVLTDRQLLTCHQDCQTSFFRSLGAAELRDVTAISLERDKEYCVIEFAEDRAQFLPPWVLYFSGCEERDRLLGALESAWKDIFQSSLPQKGVSDASLQRRCGEALALIRSAWQRSDSLHRGRERREPWC
ncbi:pleckstrin homology domain-containing family M member 2-like isoform X1 [Megalops cyprinoides]|uniref:pleckstrin homology domain-containing family M member 2-like isoform X1 n=1 Tax=Megalops cyprinoides TaxID=118141 RepID=UPI0018643599|nr:pleckstrin homology domain-containing family M member 2-like isoform X1 [Megalops cyprinoides]